MQPKGNMIVDIGGGTTEKIALGGIVCDKSVKLQVTFSQMISYITCVPNTIYLLEKVQLKNKNWSGN
jgi:actin-like ATPase involved in cell morphogenesis